jgi:hypothetical protein
VDGLYYAGCKRGLTYDKAVALSESFEDQNLSALFIAAIQKDLGLI